MKNTTIFNSLINRYNAIAYTHKYIWGFEYKGNIYMTFAEKEVMPLVCKLDVASRGAGYALRFRPTNDQKLLLMEGTQVLCSKKFFEEQVNVCKYNRGDVFEKLVTEHYGQVWSKNSVPFTKAGDIVIDGTHYQVKYQQATFCNERSIANLEREAR